MYAQRNSLSILSQLLFIYHGKTLNFWKTFMERNISHLSCNVSSQILPKFAVDRLALLLLIQSFRVGISASKLIILADMFMRFRINSGKF